MVDENAAADTPGGGLGGTMPSNPNTLCDRKVFEIRIAFFYRTFWQS